MAKCGVATTETTYAGATVLVAQVADPAFTDGVVGWGKAARSLLPVGWLHDLPAEELAAESSRRDRQRSAGLPVRTVLLVLGWNLVGATTGSMAIHLAQRSPAGALLSQRGVG